MLTNLISELGIEAHVSLCDFTKEPFPNPNPIPNPNPNLNPNPYPKVRGAADHAVRAAARAPTLLLSCRRLFRRRSSVFLRLAMDS